MTVALPVIAVTGLEAEARIARGSGVVTVAGGGDPIHLARQLESALARGARGVISFGIAGGLAPGLVPGQVVLARAVRHDGSTWTADEGWSDRLAARLPEAIRDDLAGADAVAAGVESKAELRRRLGAAAVDMESHVAAHLAALHGVPFAALRVVADPAGRALPEAAARGMRPDGSVDLRAVMTSLARRPGQIPALIRTARDAAAAFGALKRSRRRLGDALGYDGGVERGTRSGQHSPSGGLFGPDAVRADHG